MTKVFCTLNMYHLYFLSCLKINSHKGEENDNNSIALAKTLKPVESMSSSPNDFKILGALKRGLFLTLEFHNDIYFSSVELLWSYSIIEKTGI